MSDHRVIAADCLGPDGLASLAAGSVDVVLSDPPYGEEAHTKQRRVKNGTEMAPIMDFASLDFASLDFASLDFASLDFASLDFASREFARVARRWVIVFCQVEQVSAWRERLTHHGLEYVRTAVWIKPDGQPQYTGDRPGMGYESLVIAHPPGRKRWNGGGRHGVWTCNKIGPDDRERTGHQTQKPVALMESLIADFTDPGELVVDAFAGSGTTGVAAKRLGRRFLGFEREQRWVDIANARIANAREQLSFAGGRNGARTARPKNLELGLAAVDAQDGEG